MHQVVNGVASIISTIYDYDLNEYAKVNDTGCEGGPLATLSRRNPFGAPGHISTVSQVLQFGAELNEVQTAGMWLLFNFFHQAPFI